MTTLAYFPNHRALNSEEPYRAFLHSAQQAGYTLAENSRDADILVIWSVLWSGRMRPNQELYNHYRSQNKPVICMDVGCLHRGSTWKIAINNINGEGYFGHTTNLDYDRPKKLGVGLGVPRSGDNILILGQHPQSLQVQNINYEQWAHNTMAELQKYTDRLIVFRHHPRARLGINGEKPQKISGTYDDFDLNWNYRAVINYNSGVGVQAGIAGCNIVVDSSSLAAPVSNTLENIESIVKTNRDHWLTEICHTEYTVEEIKQGLWVKRLETNLPKA